MKINCSLVWNLLFPPCILQAHCTTATTRYIFDTSGPLSRLMATSGDQNYATTFWIYGLGLIYDSDGKYYLEDASGNTRFTANSSGSKSTSANYDPFGNVRSSSGILPDFQFNRQQLDNESNLYFLRARYYDPQLGRFVSKDPVKGPLTLPQSQNPYAYALNNPINLSDPSGEQAILQKCLELTLNIGQRLVGIGQRVLNLFQKSVPKSNIKIGSEALKHIEERHTLMGEATLGKSIFAEGENISALVKQASSTQPILQAGGNLQRVIDTGRIIGADRSSGLPTSIYTVITDKAGNLVTAFPGKP